MASDRILISRIDCLASVGVNAEERASKQHLSVDLEFLIDASKPAATDSIKDTIDYAKVAATVAQVCDSQPFHLIETIAERIATRVLADYPTSGARVLLRKIAPVKDPPVEYVSLEIVRP
jgi:dihydroneopterin aldolase